LNGWLANDNRIRVAGLQKRWLDMDFSLGRENPLPLYYQLKQHIIEQIARGELTPGQMLPSERQYQEMLSVSRATVRQALNELVNDGYLERQQGVGTIVARKKIAPQLLRLTSFSEDMRSRGFSPGSVTLKIEQSLPSSQVRKIYQLSGDTPICSVYRLRHADGDPIGLQRLYLPPWLSFTDDDLLNMNSYYRLLEERFNLSVDHAHEILTAKNATPQEAELLKIASGQALLYIERSSYDKEDRILEFVQFVYRADRYQYELMLYR
jgi:GntR family transcriptional regulator